MKKWLYWLAPVVWMGVIFYSSSQPYEEQDLKPGLLSQIDLSFLTPYLDWINFVYHKSEVSIATLGIDGLIEFFIRKGAHVAVFLILLLTFYYAFSRTWHKGTKFTLLVSFVSTAIYACADEFHQGITPNRTPFLGDVLLDCLGALLGIVIILLLNYKRRKHL